MGRSWLFSDCTAALMFFFMPAMNSRAECQGRWTSHTRRAPAWLPRKQQVRPWGEEWGKGWRKRGSETRVPREPGKMWKCEAWVNYKHADSISGGNIRPGPTQRTVTTLPALQNRKQYVNDVAEAVRLIQNMPSKVMKGHSNGPWWMLARVIWNF